MHVAERAKRGLRQETLHCRPTGPNVPTPCVPNPRAGAPHQLRIRLPARLPNGALLGARIGARVVHGQDLPLTRTSAPEK